MPASKYKQIKLNGSHSLGTDINDAVATLNSHFNPDDFFVTNSGNELDVWLRQVNLKDLSDATHKVSRQFDDEAAMFEILRAVESIKSYGINGNKRLYVGYNSERKVVDRKLKEQRRGKHYYANDHDFAKLNNALPEEFNDQIICGDSEEVLKRLPDNCVDLVSHLHLTTSGWAIRNRTTPTIGKRTSPSCSPYSTSALGFSNTAGGLSSMCSRCFRTTSPAITSSPTTS